MPWKSRWSCVRFVNTAAAKWMASARWSSSACEETSITQARSPASSIARNVRCRSIASGVVRTTSCSSPPITLVTVPSSPVGRPPSSSSARTRNAVVVFPLVPVIPTVWSEAVGSPKKRAATGAIAARAEDTRTSGTPRPNVRSTTSATAPRSIAAGAKSWPSRVNPGTQKNSVPGTTCRVSYARSVTSTSVAFSGTSAIRSEPHRGPSVDAAPARARPASALATRWS